jgi:FtsJ-like methyltransferase
MTDMINNNAGLRARARNRHRVWNPILKRDIWLNDRYYKEYQSIRSKDRDVYPYQGRFLRRQGRVIFAHRDRIQKYIRNNREFTDIMSRFRSAGNGNSDAVFDLDSDIDIFKMIRYDPTIDAKYLIQQDRDLVDHMRGIIRSKEELDEVSGFIFLPYVPGSDMNVNSLVIEPHNRYRNIKIIDNENFVSYLKGQIPDPKQLGELLFEFNKLFYHYDSMLLFMSEFIDEEVTEDNLMDSVAKYEKMRVYGITKDAISRRLKRRNDELKKFKEAGESCDRAEYYDKYFEQLAASDRIEEKDIVSNVRGCNASLIDIDDLIYEELDEFTTYDQYLNFCKTMKFAPTDTYDGHTFQPICIGYVEKIKNSVIRDNLTQNPDLITDQAGSICLNISDKDRIGQFNLFEEFMPEWHEAVYRNSIEDAFDHRQLLIGDVHTTHLFRNCTLMYRADPFISRECYLPGLIHDMELNKLIISCVANSDDVFPIRIINGRSIENMQMYEPFKVTDEDRLMGSLTIKLKGKDTRGEFRYYNSYLYYNPDKRLKLTPVNFRSNVIIPGTVMEHIRSLHIEMNTLLYYYEDIGTRLYFYKVATIDDNFDILVSRYSMSEIRERYRSFDSFENLEFLTDLKEVTLGKNFDKRFKFTEVDDNREQTGGSNENENETDKSYRLDIKCLGRENYKWNIQTGDEPIVFDKEVFSVSLFREQIKLIDRFFDLAGNKIYDTKCVPINYLKGFTTHMIAKNKSDQIRELWAAEGIKQKDSTGKLYRVTLNMIEDNQTILAYNFESTVSMYLYHQLLNYLKPELGKKYIIFGKNNYLLDGLSLYAKSVLLKSISSDIDFFLYAYRYKVHDKITNYLQVNKIKPHTIDEPMNNDWIERQADKLEKIDYSIVDMAIGIDSLSILRYTYLFQSQVAPIILSLKKMNEGGVLIINMFMIPNKMVFNFLSLLSCMFEEAFIDDFWESDLHATGQIIHSIVIFRGFKGVDDSDLNNMMNLNKTMYEFDETGGYGFNIRDPKIIETFDIDSDGSSEREVASQFVTNVIDIDSPEIDRQYEAYKEYMKMKMLGSIRNFTQRMNIFLSRDDQEKVENICRESKATAVYLAKKYHFPLLDWVEKIPDEYFDKMIEKNFESINYTYLRKLSKVSDLQLGSFDSVRCDYCPKLEESRAISENAYLYIEKINYDRYRGVELFVNNRYKNLNKKLQKEYKIDINGKYVSRAWIKFFELLSDTDLLEGFENNDELNVFHICEAPGNFINSMQHFVDKNTNIKNLNWTAQSLEADMGGLHDRYGFMKETKDRWDRGPKDTGDIMDKENFDYYLDKYGGSDFLISDCGEGWSETVPDNRNLTIYQMFYALLFPKTGGGFVIKTFTMKYNNLFLSLLYIACSMYESIMMFKSYTNFWSFEIYIVGKNKKDLSVDDKNVLLECLNNLFKGETTYPIDSIPDSFVQEYDRAIHNLVSYVADINKFFVFLSTNNGIFNRNKRTIDEIIKDKNSGWIDKYVRRKGLANI